MRDFWRKYTFLPLSFDINPWFWNEVCPAWNPRLCRNLGRYNLFGLQIIFHVCSFSKQRPFNTFFFFKPALICFFGEDNKAPHPRSEIFALCLEYIKAIHVWHSFNSGFCIVLFLFLYFQIYCVSFSRGMAFIFWVIFIVLVWAFVFSFT